ncbi:VOC family protein [Myxosarcina sp. GI1]|uniref:VOC family protein n=1 Tax=Myxosarcina sp. GI1 TaxID=1541065 RepID=UPI00056BE001|nr:VOC family protein [Myxosarcina sp. GI1]
MISGLNHLNLSVTNLEASFDFYTQKLQFKPLAKWKRGVYMLAGDLWFCLSLNRESDRHVASVYTHYAFSISQTELNYYRQNIKQLNLRLWQDNTSEGDSLYILDPDNHKLELHVGNWQTRLNAVKENSYEEMIFYV